MRKFMIAAIGSVGLSLLAAGSAFAAPPTPISSAPAYAPLVQDVAWRRVCNTRSVWRHNRYGQPYRTKVRDCDRVWVGKRRYDGPYYSQHRNAPRYHQGPSYGYGRPIYR
ncbi:MAG TPA: hypothetical protein VLA00_03625 [Xanthobacteraceae bacterium]|nr:hypothetical protein [Xanthobacteraceae bacterium]